MTRILQGDSEPVDNEGRRLERSSSALWRTRRRAHLFRVGILGTTVGVIVAFVAFSGVRGQDRSKSTKKRSSTPNAIVIRECSVQHIHGAVLSSERSGIISMLDAREGDSVEEGSLVIQLRDESAQAQLMTATTMAENDVSIRYARRLFEVRLAEYEKALQANQDRDRTYADLEVRRLRLEAQRALLQIEQAEHQFRVDGMRRDEAEIALKSYRIEAPFAGTVTRVHKLPGEAAQEGEPILELVNTDRVRVQGYIPLKRAWRVKRGSYVTVEPDESGSDLGLPDAKFDGQIVFVDVNVEPSKKVVKVWAEVTNRDEILRKGITVKMLIYPDH